MTGASDSSTAPQSLSVMAYLERCTFTSLDYISAGSSGALDSVAGAPVVLGRYLLDTSLVGLVNAHEAGMVDWDVRDWYGHCIMFRNT